MSKLIARGAIAALVSASVVACSDDGTPTVTPDASVVVTLDSIEVLSAAFTVVEGSEIRFSAIGHYSDDSNRNLTNDVTWSSSATEIATVGATGIANAISAGTADISAEFEGITGSETLTVLRSPISSIDVEPGASELLIAATQQLSATATLQDGSTQAVTEAVSWTSSDETVATVSAGGLVTAVGAGEAKITARDDGTGATGSSDISVRAPDAVSIVISPDPLDLEVGQTQNLTATLYFEDDSTADVTSEVVWSSNDVDVAPISNETGSVGVLTAASAGRATIQATHEASGLSDEARVTVNPPTLVGLRVTPQTVTLELQQRVSFSATAVYSDNTERPVTGSVTWISSDENIVLVSNMPGSLGQAQAVGVGTVTITAINEETGLSSDDTGMSATITVNAPAPTSVYVVPPVSRLPLGLTQQFQAFQVFSDDSASEITSTAIWSSSNPAVATVDATGLVTTVSTGTTTISAIEPTTGLSSDAAGTSAAFTVDPPVAIQVAVTPSAPQIENETSVQFTATVTYSDGTVVDGTSSVTWRVNSPGVLIDATGLARASSVGSYAITATEPATNITGQAILTVIPPTQLSITVSPATTSHRVGDVVNYVAVAAYSNNTTVDITTQVAWASSDPTVATISNSLGSEGVATAVGYGLTTISATDVVTGLSSDTAGMSASLSVPTLTAITVNPGASTIRPGESASFTAVATYSDNSTFNITDFVTWSSSTPSVATVVANPGAATVATALTAGTTSIVATDPLSGVSSTDSAGSAALTVSAVTVQSITVTPATLTIGVTNTDQLTAMATYSDNSTADITEAVTWSSSDVGIVTADNTAGARGQITGVAVGVATIDALHVPSGVTSATGATGATITVEQRIVTADVVHYELEEAPGSTSVANSAPGGSPGTLSGTFSWVQPGGAPAPTTTALENVSSRIAPNLASTAFTDLTIDFWFQYVTGTGIHYVYNSGISFRAFTGGVAGTGFYVRATPGGGDIVLTQNIQDGLWHHFCYVLDATSGQGRFYLDGVPSGTTAYSGSINITSWVLAGQSGSNAATLRYDRFRVWSTAATAAEVGDMIVGNR